MALKSSDGSIPEGAIPLTKTEALYYQWQQLRNWPSRWDVWPIHYGVPTIAFIASLSALKINSHYRLKLKLRRFGRASTTLAIGLTPVLFTITPHYIVTFSIYISALFLHYERRFISLIFQFVTEELFLDKQCIICLYTRAVGIQIFTSTIYPMMMSPIANFMFATRHGTYRLPYWADYKGTIKLLFSLHKSLLPKIKIMLPVQVAAACFMTYLEARHLHLMRKKIEFGEIEGLPQIFI